MTMNQLNHVLTLDSNPPGGLWRPTGIHIDTGKLRTIARSRR
jgi:hypothetical protein